MNNTQSNSGPQSEDFGSYIIAGECTDVGRKRKANEDSCRNGTTLNGFAATVCDGMGGHVGGATASRIAVDTIFSTLDSHYFDDPRQAISDSIDAANRAILAYADANPGLRGMGSTCTLLLVRNGMVYLGHVGDSRIYLVRDGNIVQISRDHSLVQQLVDSGELRPEEAETDSRKNIITNALGIPNMQPATIEHDAMGQSAFLPQAGDVFLLCSDGLSGMISNESILRIARPGGTKRTAERARELVNAANEAGGLDNISVELVEFASSPAASHHAPDSGRRPMPRNISIIIAIATAVILLAAGGLLWWHFRSPDDSTATDPAGQAAVTTDTGNAGDKGHTPPVTTKADTITRNLGDVTYNDKANPFMVIELTGKSVVVTYKSQGKEKENEYETDSYDPAATSHQTSTAIVSLTDKTPDLVTVTVNRRASANELKQEQNVRLTLADGRLFIISFTLKAVPAPDKQESIIEVQKRLKRNKQLNPGESPSATPPSQDANDPSSAPKDSIKDSKKDSIQTPQTEETPPQEPLQHA